MSDLPKKKIYLLMIDEAMIPILHSAMPALQFIEVEALNMTDNEDYVLLANPKPKVIEEGIAPTPCAIEEEITPKVDSNAS